MLFQEKFLPHFDSLWELLGHNLANWEDRKEGFFNREDTLQYFSNLQSRESLSSHLRQCLCFAKVFLSHRSHAGNEHGLGALQHSIHFAIWTKASLFYDFCGSPCIFIQINNFFKLHALGIKRLTLGSQLPPTPPGLVSAETIPSQKYSMQEIFLPCYVWRHSYLSWYKPR